ncbi:hypothetical protein [Streptomyces sp. S1D4-20]|uniref:hypothetical protein n=1 Tax=Streptomyces sp. S1D4-20 TaxID=2594462 RepID=UPI0011642C79|nr:hypothetical protein [Streptomyces sp. S1D4-20]QDN54211.1 hypothetical protein FNV67_01180 [Streptomyces sp. S1D4-20]
MSSPLAPWKRPSQRSTTARQRRNRRSISYQTARAEKLQKARPEGLERVAGAHWDLVRAALKDLPPRMQPMAWKELGGLLERLESQLRWPESPPSEASRDARDAKVAKAEKRGLDRRAAALWDAVRAAVKSWPDEERDDVWKQAGELLEVHEFELRRRGRHRDAA